MSRIPLRKFLTEHSIGCQVFEVIAMLVPVPLVLYFLQGLAGDIGLLLLSFGIGRVIFGTLGLLINFPCLKLKTKLDKFLLIVSISMVFYATFLLARALAIQNGF